MTAPFTCTCPLSSEGSLVREHARRSELSGHSAPQRICTHRHIQNSMSSRVYLYSFGHHHRMPMSRIDVLTLLSPGFRAGRQCILMPRRAFCTRTVIYQHPVVEDQTRGSNRQDAFSAFVFAADAAEAHSSPSFSQLICNSSVRSRTASPRAAPK